MLPVARTSASAEPDLADLPAQPCPSSVGGRPIQRPTLTFKTLDVLVVIAHGRRELVHVNVTSNPTAAWVWRQLIEATSWARKPRHPLRDRDAVYGRDLRRRARRIGIDAIATPIKPAQGERHRRTSHRHTLRRECLDQLIILDEQHLASVLSEFVR